METIANDLIVVEASSVVASCCAPVDVIPVVGVGVGVGEGVVFGVGEGIGVSGDVRTAVATAILVVAVVVSELGWAGTMGCGVGNVVVGHEDGIEAVVPICAVTLSDDLKAWVGATFDTAEVVDALVAEGDGAKDWLGAASCLGAGVKGELVGTSFSFSAMRLISAKHRSWSCWLCRISS